MPGPRGSPQETGYRAEHRSRSSLAIVHAEHKADKLKQVEPVKHMNVGHSWLRNGLATTVDSRKLPVARPRNTYRSRHATRCGGTTRQTSRRSVSAQR